MITRYPSAATFVCAGVEISCYQGTYLPIQPGICSSIFTKRSSKGASSRLAVPA